MTISEYGNNYATMQRRLTSLQELKTTVNDRDSNLQNIIRQVDLPYFIKLTYST